MAIHYPNCAASPGDIFSQRTLDLATANLLSWRQAAGAFGEMHLHACWGDSSAISRRYHGETIGTLRMVLHGAMGLYDVTRRGRWRDLAEDVVGEILFLQTPKGGFYHASAEYEPTYTCEQSCPIHQGLPVLALLEYLAWSHANPARREAIRDAIEAHWRWFEGYWWKRGSDERGKPLPEAGFCGVTNQDLVIVAVLARYGQVFGDMTRYEQFGKPTLDMFLGPQYYREALGLFERSGEGNFVERTTYYHIVVETLEIVYGITKDERLPGVIDNVAVHLFDTLHTGADGLTHPAWGATLDETDPTRVKEWIKYPYIVSEYPLLLAIMDHYLQRHPDEALRQKYLEFEKTLAAYVYADGSLPSALGRDPIFAVVGKTPVFWGYLIKRLGVGLQDPAPVTLPVLHRSVGSLTLKGNGRLWAIEKDGVRVFAGLKANPSGIAIGPDEPLVGGDLGELASPVVQEEFENLN
jgi:hypothetical protein